jgi:hypothetical protein
MQCSVHLPLIQRSSFASHRLRQKFRHPYQTMQSNVKRLQRLQQVSDVLRRTSRFTTLAKRLQAQMVELGNDADADNAESRPKTPGAKANSGILDGRRSATPGLDQEGEKERSLAQAALTIAELGKDSEYALLIHPLTQYVYQGTFWRSYKTPPQPLQRACPRLTLSRRLLGIFRSAPSMQSLRTYH